MTSWKKHLMGKFILLPVLLLTAVITQAGRETGPMAEKPTVTVYRSPNCGCCRVWITHLQRNGFNVVEHQSHEMAEVKKRYRIPGQLRSCHTAVVEGYVIEGHVPATDIRRLLQERPMVAGLAVPGMPAGSPGMEMGSRKDPFSVFGFTVDGSFEVFQAHGPAGQ